MQALPRLRPLDQIAQVVGNDSFSPSGAAADSACDIVIVGGQWGTLVHLRREGAAEPATGTIPGARRVARLESSRGRVLAWSHNRPFVGFVNADLTVDSIVLPRHPWGSRWAGPVVLLGEDLLAIAPLGDPRAKRRRPERWVEAPTALIIDRQGHVVNTVGTVRQTAGLYLPWLAARVTLGANGDTLLVLELGNGRLTKYYPTSPAGWAGVLSTSAAQLPVYVEAPPPRETVRPLPWIQAGGDFTAFTDAPQVAHASFDDRGRVYAVRNYAFAWRPRAATLLPAGGAWEATRQGLEIYDSEGNVLSALELPAGGIDWLRVAGGLLLLRRADRSILVARNPVAGKELCSNGPSPIPAITAVDAPPGRSLQVR